MKENKIANFKKAKKILELGSTVMGTAVGSANMYGNIVKENNLAPTWN